MNVWEFIPKGIKNAISREELCRRTGLNDRMVRQYVAEAAEHGEIVLNVGSGYFRYGGKKDEPYLNEYLAKEQARVKAINRKLRKIKKARKNNG